MNGFGALGDVSAIESRIAQLSGDSGAVAPSSELSAGAFQSLLNGMGAKAAVAPARIERLIAGAAAATGEDPALVKAVVANESGFDPAATSCTGAQGLMQLMPETAAEMGVSDAYDPAPNIAGGTRYLAQLLQRFGGDLPLALAAYNAGPEAVANGKIPAETRDYVASVLASYARYREQR
jgi:soluble lytic murein transglycosylase-like protein